MVQRKHQLRGRGLVRMEIRVVKLVEAQRVDQNSSLLMKKLKDWLKRQKLKLRGKELQKKRQQLRQKELDLRLKKQLQRQKD